MSYVVLHMRSVVQHLHDICMVHISAWSFEVACGLMVRLSAQVRVRARDRKWSIITPQVERLGFRW